MKLLRVHGLACLGWALGASAAGCGSSGSAIDRIDAGGDAGLVASACPGPGCVVEAGGGAAAAPGATPPEIGPHACGRPPFPYTTTWLPFTRLASSGITSIR